jgi:glycerol kinase
MTDFLLALDQGTTSSRSIVFHRSGRIAAMAQREFRQHFPQPGWVEHDPEEIWQTQLLTAREALAQARLQASDIAAVGITNQRETTLLWDRASGTPLHPAIVWQDRRTEPLCVQLRERGLAALVQEKTGLLIDAYFSATKLRWLLDHVPGARDRALQGELAFGTVDTWLLWKLTGGALHATDVSNASRTMLFDVRAQAWDEALLDALDIPAALLPSVHPSSHHYGQTLPELLGAALPIGGVAGDQQAALFGQACFRPGMAKNTYGTGCFLLMHTGERFQPSAHGLVATAAAQVDARPQHALEGSVFVGGAVVQWLRDGLRAIAASGDVEALAQSAPDAGGVVFVPAFTGLGAPYWQPDARGAILGLSRGSTAAHIARAALESIAFQVMDVLRAMEADAKIKLKELRVDGGASANNLLMQLQADLLNVPVVRPKVSETTALGAAYLAGLAVGYWKSQADIARQWQADRKFTPAMKPAARKQIASGWEKALSRAKGWEES